MAKDRWDKAEIASRPLGAFLTALVIAYIGWQGSAILESRQASQAKSQLYAQLMSSREQSDSELRQVMFQTIIDQFLVSSAQDGDGLASDEIRLRRFDDEVLRLEVLAYNFHDALDLGPLFKDVHRRLEGESANSENSEDAQESADGLLDRLRKVAGDVNHKQIAALEDGGFVARATIPFDELGEKGILLGFINETAKKTDKNSMDGKAFSVDVVSVDTSSREIEIRLTVWGLDDSGAATGDPIFDLPFHVGFFDFPMIDNTRLGDGERCAIVLTAFDDLEADVTLVYFPGSRASLKEKPFYDEVIKDLLGETET